MSRARVGVVVVDGVLGPPRRALLLAALDHCLELPEQRAGIPDHDWSGAT